MICSNKISKGTANDSEMLELAVYPNTFCPDVPSGDIPPGCCRSPITSVSELDLDSGYFANFPTLPRFQNEVTHGSQVQDVFKYCGYNVDNVAPSDGKPFGPNDITDTIGKQVTKNFIRLDLVVIIALFFLLYMVSRK